MAFALAILALAVPAGGPAAAATLAPIELHPITGEDRIAFAVKFLHKHFPNVVNWSFSSGRRAQEDWSSVVARRALAAEIDLGPVGAPQLVIVIDDPNWCDPLGCLGAIFRKAKDGYEYICEAPLPGASGPPAQITSQVENGYRRIATANRVIEWNEAQDFDSGTLCSVEAPER